MAKTRSSSADELVWQQLVAVNSFGLTEKLSQIEFGKARVCSQGAVVALDSRISRSGPCYGCTYSIRFLD